jgi:hypothetical protein
MNTNGDLDRADVDPDLDRDRDLDSDLDADAGTSVVSWPASALDAAERGFRNLLLARPHPVAFDARGVGHGLPARLIPLDELRQLLVRDPRVPYAAKDAVWHQLVDHARVWGQPWVAAAVGLALPALVAMAGRLCAGRDPGLVPDIESELVAGFIDALKHADLSGPAPYARMCWAGWRAALLVRSAATWEEVPELFDPSSRLPARPYGHPDLLLGRATRAGVIRSEEAELISETRLGRVLIDEVAARSGVNPAVLRMRRRRAELAVVAALREGRLEAQPQTAERGRRGRGLAGQVRVGSGQVRVRSAWRS